MAQRSRTRYLILAILGYGAPLSPHKIYQKINKSTASFWNESEGQIYPALEKLLADGHVTLCEAPQGVRARKLYTITEAGLADLTSWMRDPPQPALMRDEALVKIQYGNYAGPESTARQVRRRELEARYKLESLDVIREDIAERLPDSPGYPYWVLSIDYGMRMLEAELQWCAEAKEKLKQMINDKS